MSSETLEELAESVEDQAKNGCGGWVLPSGQNCLVQSQTGHLTAVHTGLLLTWAESLKKLTRMARSGPEIANLVKGFLDEVEAFRALGRENPEYLAREKKIRAYGLLMATGLSPSEAVAAFKEISSSVRPA